MLFWQQKPDYINEVKGNWLHNYNYNINDSKSFAETNLSSI